ncbi:MAG: hypothetical protein EBZ53_06445 [Verrucomicrobia bacterium]|nr:hypothetical protein [Verrucomicrobiota bacterium]
MELSSLGFFLCISGEILSVSLPPGDGAAEAAIRWILTSRSSTIPFSFNSSLISSSRQGVVPYFLKFS